MLSLAKGMMILALGSAVNPLFAQEIVYPPSVAIHQAHVPEAVHYAIVFHQTAAFEHMADNLDSQGKDGGPYRRHLCAKFGLTPQQLASLELVALQYREDVKQADDSFQASIFKFRDLAAQLPEGATMPPPPSEASYLIAQRDAVTLRARDQLHRLIGDQAFAKIDILVKTGESTSPALPQTQPARPRRVALTQQQLSTGEAGAYGYTSVFYDPTTRVVTAYAETEFYGSASYYYGAMVKLISNGMHAEAAGQPGDSARATLTYQGVEAKNYYAQGEHSALMLEQARRLKSNDYYGLQQWGEFDVMNSGQFAFTAFAPATDDSTGPFALGQTY